LRRRSCGVEYVIDDRTGRQLYYDVNALSNFVPIRCGWWLQSLRALADFLIAEAGATKWNARARCGAWRLAMRYGYWLPVFGGWLRNVEDEKMETSWAYVKKLAQRSERIGFDLTLIAELNLNDIKGVRRLP